MGNAITGPAVAEPSSISSGGSTTITVPVDSEDGGTMTLTPTTGFQVVPLSLNVAAGAASVSFDVKITRKAATTNDCDLDLGFFASSEIVSVEVT